MNKKLLLGIGSVVMALALGLAACNGSGTTGGGQPMGDAELPTEANYGSNVMVHDPSVFKDIDGTYYAFGTHYNLASSKDLITWTQLARDGQFNVIYGNETCTDKNGTAWPKAIEDTVNLVNPIANGNDTIKTTWAPDVIKLGRKYYMYYSLTEKFGSKRSAIGRVEADNVMGPYTNNTIIISSNISGGTNVVNGPNAIDPTVFWDNDGKLWMVYGSDSAGIYLIGLNASGDKVGLPTDEYQSYIDSGDPGEPLWQGGGNNAEGPYIFYNESTGYYYLMCSYGSLLTTYNMRVARSKSVMGPYTDIENTEMTNSRSGGNKLAGNYQFAGDTGYAALGHNSVIKEDGKYLVVHHIRQEQGRNNVTAGHHLEVRQLFFNEDGWPVLSPNRYAGETFGVVEESVVVGEYDLILHNPGITIDFARSAKYMLNEDGTITQGESGVGTWEVKSGCYITLTLNGVEYKGVVAPGWCKYQSRAVYSITATNGEGNALWANPVAPAEAE